VKILIKRRENIKNIFLSVKNLFKSESKTKLIRIFVVTLQLFCVALRQTIKRTKKY